MSPLAREFVSACLAKAAADRLTARDALLHPWVLADADGKLDLTSARRGVQKMQMRRKFKVGVDAARQQPHA